MLKDNNKRVESGYAMERITDYDINTFIERVSNGRYTALYNEGVFVGGITIRDKSCFNGRDIAINISRYNWYITINNNHNVLTIVVDSFNN